MLCAIFGFGMIFVARPELTDRSATFLCVVGGCCTFVLTTVAAAGLKLDPRIAPAYALAAICFFAGLCMLFPRRGVKKERKRCKRPRS
jgi:hypothetical protein